MYHNISLKETGLEIEHDCILQQSRAGMPLVSAGRPFKAVGEVFSEAAGRH